MNIKSHKGTGTISYNGKVVCDIQYHANEITSSNWKVEYTATVTNDYGFDPMKNDLMLTEENGKRIMIGVSGNMVSNRLRLKSDGPYLDD